MGNSFRQTVAGIFSHTKMNESLMLEGHLDSTKRRCQSSEGTYLVASQDTCFYNYNSHHAMEGLGLIQGNVKGIIQHNLMLFSELGIPLGLIDQQYWSRTSEHSFEGKESLKWTNGLDAVNQHLGGIDKRVVVVQDREADIFAFFKASRAENVDLLVRIHQPRNMEIESSGEVCKLTQIADHLPIIGTKQISLFRSNKEVKVTLSLQASRVKVFPDKNLSAKKHQTQCLSLVIAKEIQAVDNQGKDVFVESEASVWHLLTSLPIDNEIDIERILDFYGIRWRIERFHYTMKSGALQVERLQFDDLTTMINALAFYSIVAWQILAITYLIRQDEHQPVEVYFEQEEVRILEQMSKKPIHTIKEATLVLVKMIGFAPSKKQPMPGVKVLAQALERFYYLKIGARLNSL